MIDGGARPQHREPDEHRLRRAPAAPVGRADERAERRARGHRRERGAADDEEPDRRRGDRAGDHRPQAVAGGDDGERHDRAAMSSAPPNGTT